MAVNTRRATVLVLLDLSAAFDTIDHEVLLRQLQDRYGIEGSPLAWLKYYNENRQQCIVIGSTRSHNGSVLHGVPQGSVLGPFLFSAYVSPIGDIVRRYDLHFHSFSDDTHIYAPFNQRCNESIKTLH